MQYMHVRMVLEEYQHNEWGWHSGSERREAVSFSTFHICMFTASEEAGIFIW